jgi:gluconokinase
MKIILMGVSGSGKTTLAQRLACALKCEPIIEADALHSPEMKEKMRGGTPLTDEDRWPWLDRVAEAIDAASGDMRVATCSALRRVYRERLRSGIRGEVHFILLHASREVLLQRLSERRHEYMPVSLLDSQLATLEHPSEDERISTIVVSGREEDTVQELTRLVSRFLADS